MKWWDWMPWSWSFECWFSFSFFCVPHPESFSSSLPLPSLWVVPVHQPQASSIMHWEMVTISLYTRQQKRHWCIEQSFGLCGRGRGWDNLGEWHWNMYNIIYETSHQSRFDARYCMLIFKPAFSLSSFTLIKRVVPIHFLPLRWYHMYILVCWYFSQQSWYQLVIHPAWHFAWCIQHIS